MQLWFVYHKQLPIASVNSGQENQKFAQAVTFFAQ